MVHYQKWKAKKSHGIGNIYYKRDEVLDAVKPLNS
jgi:hypothetical protein